MRHTLPAGHTATGAACAGRQAGSVPSSHDRSGHDRARPARRARRWRSSSWRDTHNPEGGGAERALEEVAEGLVERGARVTVFSAAHAGAPPEDEIRGVRYVRRGSKLTVYAARDAGPAPRRPRATPTWWSTSRTGCRSSPGWSPARPVIVLVHHVHREQWPVVYPGTMGKVGWWIESRFAPRLYRRCQYVTGSQATRDELAHLGCRRQRIAVVHYGTDRQRPLELAARPITRASAWWAGWCPTSRWSTPSTPSSSSATRSPGLTADRRRQRLVGARPARVRRGARPRRRGAVPGAGRRARPRSGSTRSPGCWPCPPSRRGGVSSSARLPWPGRRRWPTRAPAGPASPSRTVEPGCWSTTRLASWTRCGGCSSTTRSGRGSARARGARRSFTWEQTRSGFADVVTKVLAGQRVSAD